MSIGVGVNGGVSELVCTPELGVPWHARHILDVIMLEYPLKVCPMPVIWVQSVSVTVIP